MEPTIITILVMQVVQLGLAVVHIFRKLRKSSCCGNTMEFDPESPRKESPHKTKRTAK
jgi:hypothetical protein